MNQLGNDIKHIGSDLIKKIGFEISKIALSLFNLLCSLILIFLIAGTEQSAFGKWLSSATSERQTFLRDYSVEQSSVVTGIHISQVASELVRNFVFDKHSGLRNSIAFKPSKVFELAYQDYLRGHYDLALTQFQAFIRDFPKNSLVPDAYFYIAECLEQEGNLLEAVSVFHEMTMKYKNNRLIPAALFKLGNLFAQTGHPEKAKMYWEKLIANFQGSTEANLASQKLAIIP